jgi:hypothetical protein
MNTNRKKTMLTIVMGATILAMLALIGGLLISNLSFSPSYEERLTRAQVYADSGDYESAILEYEQAIEEDATDPEAYLELAQIYQTTEQIQKAIEILQQGFALTGSERIAWLQEELELLGKAKVPAEEEEAAKKPPAEEVVEEVAPETEHNVSGKVIDASTGRGVSAAKLEIRAGTSLAVAPVDTINTDSQGFYSIQLDKGQYWVTIIKHGYTKEDFKIQVADSASKQVEDLVITGDLRGGEIRIVLTWDQNPRDLDSYLTGSLDNGTRVDVDFTQRQAHDSAQNLVADLDVDDVDGYGPETITLYNSNGSFEYYVQDFTRSGTMSQSHAQVKIYVGGAPPVIVDVPAGLSNAWSVCRIEDGRVTVTNVARGR